MSLSESKFDEGSAEQGNRIVKATKRCSRGRAWRIPIRNEDSATKETKVAENQNGNLNNLILMSFKPIFAYQVVRGVKNQN